MKASWRWIIYRDSPEPDEIQNRGALRTPVAGLIEDSNVHIGVLLAPLIAVALWFMLEKSLLGFQFRVLGQAAREVEDPGVQEVARRGAGEVRVGRVQARAFAGAVGGAPALVGEVEGWHRVVGVWHVPAEDLRS